MKNPFGSLRFKFKSSKQLLFSLWAAGMILLVAGAVVWGSVFLGSHLKEALSADELKKPEPPVRFDIEGFERLQLTK